MRRFSSNFALAICLVMGASVSAPSIAGPLYQWTSKNGTPTYSPDPPPKGVNYTLVGDDLKPLPKSIDMANPPPVTAASVASRAPQATKAPVASTRLKSPAVSNQHSALPQHVVKKPLVPWKPVRYANNPNPSVKSKVTPTVKPAVDPVVAARNSKACIRARQQMALLEGQFAQAVTDEQMDRAILQLSAHKPSLQSACMVN